MGIAKDQIEVVGEQRTLTTASLSCTACRASQSWWSGQAPSGSMLLRRLPLNSTGSCSTRQAVTSHRLHAAQCQPSNCADMMLRRLALSSTGSCHTRAVRADVHA